MMKSSLSGTFSKALATGSEDAMKALADSLKSLGDSRKKVRWNRLTDDAKQAVIENATRRTFDGGGALTVGQLVVNPDTGDPFMITEKRKGGAYWGYNLETGEKLTFI